MGKFNRSGGGGEVTSAQLASKASKLVVDQLIADNATQAELDAINLALTNQIAAKPDLAITSAVRQGDQSILVTYSDASTSSIPATPNTTYDDTAIAGRVTTLEAHDHTQLHDGAAQDAALAAHSGNAAAHMTGAEKALLHDGVAQDNAIALETTRATGEETRIQVELDTQEAKQDAHETSREAHLPNVKSALQFVRRNAADTDWEAVDLPITPDNLKAGVGTPLVGIGQDGDYYLQLDAGLGVNDIWGPKAAGAWPAQADARTADPVTGLLTQAGDVVEGVIPKSWTPDELSKLQDVIVVPTQIAAQTTDIQPGGILQIGEDNNYLGTYINKSAVSQNWTTPGEFATLHQWRGGILVADGASPVPNDRRLYYSDWTIGAVADPSREREYYWVGIIQATEAEWGAMSTAQAQATEIVWTYYQSQEDPASPTNYVWLAEKSAISLSVQLRGASGEQWVVGVINVIFQDDTFDPATLLPTAVLGQDIAVKVLPADRADALTAPESMEGEFHAWSCIDLGNGPFWLKTRSPKPHDHEVLENIAVHVRSAGTNASSSVDIELLLDGAWNPTDWVVSTAPGTGLESYTAHAALHIAKSAITGPINIGHNKDGWLFFEYVGSATEAQLTGVNYTGANGANSDGEIIVNFAGTNQAVTFADKAAVVVTDLEFEQPEAVSQLEIIRYTADGAIQNKDHRAIFETGADTMTLPVSSQDRLIQIISEGPATIITADGTEQFTGPGGTTTDGTLNVNATFQWATLLGRGAAAGWSQYVGQVATAQSVGSMVDFSESPGPGDAGSFTLALTNSGANLRYILTLTCSNGTNFSPPLDVDDGTNRWWYDFDHTTGVVNIRRFGAFAGGSVRGVALYS